MSEVKEFVDKYWHDAIKAETRLKVPAVYLLAHAAEQTCMGASRAFAFEHGFEVVTPKKVSKLKEWWNKFTSLFKKKEPVLKKIVSEYSGDTDNVHHFLNNVSYHAKFEYLQSADRLCEYLYRGKENKKQLTDNMKQLIKAIHEVKHT